VPPGSRYTPSLCGHCSLEDPASCPPAERQLLSDWLDHVAPSAAVLEWLCRAMARDLIYGGPDALHPFSRDSSSQAAWDLDVPVVLHAHSSQKSRSLVEVVNDHF
jgi:hypothetical protein